MRAFLTIPDVAPLARSVFPDRRVAELTRLTGGSTKGVYRLTFSDGETALVYRWHRVENFWPARTAIDVGPFVGDPGQAGFVAQHALLGDLGARVPRLFGLDGDLALVEDIRGGTLEALLARDPAAGIVVLDRLREMLHRMHSHLLPPAGPPGSPSCEDVLVERGRRALVEAAARVPEIAAAEDRVAYALSSRFAAVQPRATVGVIHGELGPDHVMVTPDGVPVLIDIEGAMRFDVEWEHAFLELRFGDLYPRLHTVPLDEARMSLCRLVMYLTLVAGPMLLLDGDFPRREGMLDIARHNTARVLATI